MNHLLYTRGSHVPISMKILFQSYLSLRLIGKYYSPSPLYLCFIELFVSLKFYLFNIYLIIVCWVSESHCSLCICIFPHLTAAFYFFSSQYLYSLQQSIAGCVLRFGVLSLMFSWESYDSSLESSSGEIKTDLNWNSKSIFVSHCYIVVVSVDF